MKLMNDWVTDSEHDKNPDQRCQNYLEIDFFHYTKNINYFVNEDNQIDISPHDAPIIRTISIQTIWSIDLTEFVLKSIGQNVPAILILFKNKISRRIVESTDEDLYRKRIYRERSVTWIDKESHEEIRYSVIPKHLSLLRVTKMKISKRKGLFEKRLEIDVA